MYVSLNNQFQHSNKFILIISEKILISETLEADFPHKKTIGLLQLTFSD